MQEREFSLKDMLSCALRKWRVIIIFAIIFAILTGSIAAVSYAIDMNDPEMISKWEAEYEVAKGLYWSRINDIDRQISENERLASHAELEIERLDIKKADYEGNIEDLESKINYYEALIEDYEADIEQLNLEKEKLQYYLDYRKDQNENNLLMAIDPYNVNVYENYIRVDSGYEILPGNTYQNQDPTPELIETYRLSVSNTEFLKTMIADLDLETEVRYITSILSVEQYGMNSICIKVTSADSEWAEDVGDYIKNAILANYDSVKSLISNHDLTVYNTNKYSVVNLDIYSLQYALIQEEINYETSIRNIEMSVLKIEDSIRASNTDIRYFNQEIEDFKIAITELPIEKKSLEDEIAKYNDINYELKSERIVLSEEEEPQYQGYTVVSVIIGFVKFAAIGFFAGAILVAVYIALKGCFGGKVVSSEQISETLNSKYFGFWHKNTKRRFAFVDNWVARVTGYETKDTTPELVTKIIFSNVSIVCEGKSKILLCGGAEKETIAAIALAAKEQLGNVDIVTGATVDNDPNVIRSMVECDAVILVEQLDKSGINASIKLKEQLNSLEKPLLGVILS